MSAIQDRAFFQRVVDDSIEVGYIHRPAHWQGHAFHPVKCDPSEETALSAAFLVADGSTTSWQS